MEHKIAAQHKIVLALTVILHHIEWLIQMDRFSVSLFLHFNRYFNYFPHALEEESLPGHTYQYHV